MKGVSGYTYNTENFCVDCILTAFSGVQERIGHVFDVDAVLDIVAGAMDINRQDERTFDSSEFPKVILDQDVLPGERCNNCGDELR